MIRILFVCHGNICRSPMAEFIMKDLIKKVNMEDKIYIESCATSTEEIGNDIDYRAKEKLDENKIPYSKRKARQMTQSDYDKFDYIVLMDYNNLRYLNYLEIEDTKQKMQIWNIDDPWYTGNFTKAYNEIYNGCENLLNTILSKEDV